MADEPTPSSASVGAGPTAVEDPKSGMQRLLAYRVLLGLALAVFVADQISKAWIVSRLTFNPYHVHDGVRDLVVSRGFFYLIQARNTGAAWSMFSDKSILLALLAASTLVAIYFWRHALGLKARSTQICFGLLCGGIVGNLCDRLLHGHVIDFIDLHFGTYIYPTFNVADSAICVGVVLYLWHSLRAPQ